MVLYHMSYSPPPPHTHIPHPPPPLLLRSSEPPTPARRCYDIRRLEPTLQATAATCPEYSTSSTVYQYSV